MKSHKPPAFTHRCVLLIDDNELDNFINSKVIEGHRFAEIVYTATNGKSALDFLKNLLLMENWRYPEVLFVDLNMPLMDGFQFIQSYYADDKLKRREVKMVVLTSSVNQNDRDRVSDFPQKITFLHKPLTGNLLETTDQ